jgi:alpha-glucosidase
VTSTDALWPWWKEAVFYQIYPRSFCLADPHGRRRRLGLTPDGGATDATDRIRDGAGDLEGIRRHLDHLVRLGVDAVWLSPFYTSPMKDFGYDVADYCKVDPLFGSEADFDRLLAEAHDRGLRVIVDFVPNHTSDQHPWFLDARSLKARRGPSTTPPVSGTCTSSSPSSRISTGPTQRSSRRWRVCWRIGSTGE